MRIKFIYKLLLLVLSFFSLTSFICEDIKYIIIKKVEFELETTFAINCSDFEEIFNREYIVDTISDIKRIKDFSYIIDSLQIYEKSGFFDTRAKIFVVYDNRIDTICVSRFDILRNSKSFNNNPELIKYIYGLDR